MTVKLPGAEEQEVKKNRRLSLHSDGCSKSAGLSGGNSAEAFDLLLIPSSRLVWKE
jgi:hypothetical protein